MTVFVVVFLALAFLVPGLALIVSAFHRAPEEPKDPPVPTAQVVHGEHSPLRDPRPRGRKRRAAGRVARFSLGAVLIGFGAMIGGLVHVLFGGGGDLMGTKGRLLRVRGKNALPEVATGDGWHDGARPRTAHLSAAERRVLADAWHLAARMEHASVAAFGQLGLHLAALGAPSELVERSHLAALDEIRHARRCFAMARAYGGQAWTAGPIAGLARADGREVDLVQLAIGSLVDGCVGEGIAADVATNGARGAEDPLVRDALATIAADEETHAELGWSVLAWCLAAGGELVRAAVAARAERLDAELAPRVPDFPHLAPERLAAHGLFDQDTIGTLAARRIRAVRERAAGLAALPRAA